MRPLFSMKRRVVILLSLFVYLCFFVFVYPFAFNFEVDHNFYYPLYLSGVIVACLAGGMLLADGAVTPCKVLLLLAPVGVLFFQSVAPPVYGIANEYLTVIGSMLAVFVLLRCF